MIAQGYTRFGGQYSETAALRNIFNSQAILDPRTQEPFSEALLFGIGGGINYAHFAMDLEKTVTFVPMGAHKGNYKGGVVQEIICQRLGVPCLRKETNGEKAAQRHLTEAFRGGRPMLAWVDLAGLTYYHLPAHYYKTFDHTLSVVGFDEEQRVLLDDRSPAPWPMNWEAFLETRSAISARKNRLLAIGAPEAVLTIEAGIELGLKHCVDNLLNPTIQNFGLPGLERFCSMLADTEGTRGWLKTFANPRSMYCALRDLFDFVELGHARGAAGGGLLRYLFANFLIEASSILDNADLAEAGTMYYRIGKRWTALAERALPDGEPFLKQTKDCLLEHHRTFEEQGPAAAKAIANARKELNNMEKAATKEFNAEANLLADVVAGLHEEASGILEAEREAARQLQSIVAKW